MPEPLNSVLSRVARGRGTTKRILMGASDLPGPDDLTQPLRDAVELFEELAIDHALIGGLAAMLHGRARYTEDIDLIAAADHEDVLAAHPETMRKHRFDPSCTWKLYHDSGATVDLWKDSHVPPMLERAAAMAVGGMDVRVVSPTDLVAMKLRAGRAQDVYDIAEVLKAGRVDEAMLRGLVTAEQYAEYEEIKRRWGGVRAVENYVISPSSDARPSGSLV